MGLSVSRKSTHLVDLVRLAVSHANVGSTVAYLHMYLSSDVHANLHNCAGGRAVASGCSIARCVLMLLLWYLHYLWFTGCAWDAMCAVTHISAGEHGVASHTDVPCVPILAGAWLSCCMCKI